MKPRKIAFHNARREHRSTQIWPLKAWGLYALLFLATCALCPPVQANPLGPECDWFGSTLGITGKAWRRVVENNRIDTVLKNHCFSAFCQRKSRVLYTHVYERMPCDDRCLPTKQAAYRSACGG